MKDWSTNESHCDQLDGKELYFTIRDRAVCLSSNQGRLSCINVPELSSRQDEANTKIFLCTAFASSLGFHAVNVITVDSDMAILSLYFQSQLDICIYLQMGTGLREKIYEVFSNDLLCEVLLALPAIHALSGCDSLSAFVGVDKVKLYNSLQQ